MALPSRRRRTPPSLQQRVEVGDAFLGVRVPGSQRGDGGAGGVHEAIVAEQPSERAEPGDVAAGALLLHGGEIGAASVRTGERGAPGGRCEKVRDGRRVIARALVDVQPRHQLAAPDDVTVERGRELQPAGQRRAERAVHQLDRLHDQAVGRGLTDDRHHVVLLAVALVVVVLLRLGGTAQELE